jgi:hypothetical protein
MQTLLENNNPFVSKLARITNSVYEEFGSEIHIEFPLREERMSEIYLRHSSGEEEIGAYRKRNERIKLFYYASLVTWLEFDNLARAIKKIKRIEDLSNIEEINDLSSIKGEIKEVFPLDYNKIQPEKIIEDFEVDLREYKKNMAISLLQISSLFSKNFIEAVDKIQIKNKDIKKLQNLIRKESTNLVNISKNFKIEVLQEYKEPYVFLNLVKDLKEKYLKTETGNKEAKLELLSEFLRFSFNLYSIFAKEAGMIQGPYAKL